MQNKSENKLPSLGKLKWQCRRGVLELDILLNNFLSNKYPSLSEPEKADFVTLLSHTDEELLLWFWGEGEPDTEALKKMVKGIKA